MDKKLKHVQESHPTRVRGLKLYCEHLRLYMTLVAPHAGAWIETEEAAKRRIKKAVAPHAGAWIET